MAVAILVQLLLFWYSCCWGEDKQSPQMVLLKEAGKRILDPNIVNDHNRTAINNYLNSSLNKHLTSICLYDKTLKITVMILISGKKKLLKSEEYYMKH